MFFQNASVLGRVDMLANERDDVRRALDTSQPEIEDELRYARRRLNLRLQNVRLERVQKPLFEQVGRDLIGDCALILNKEGAAPSRLSGNP